MAYEQSIEFSFESLWALLVSSEQTDACACFWSGSSARQQEAEQQVVAALAGLLHFREKFVRQRPVGWRTTELCRRLTHPA